jgi:uncharacterized protein (DUF2249 family)
VLDARLIPCSGKHEQIFHRWAALMVGESFVLLNDHRPEPLRRQFEQFVPGCFEWAAVPPPPGGFAVRLTRLRPDPAGFDASLVNGCGSLGARSGATTVAADEDILVRIHLDFRECPVGEAHDRVLRLAQGLADGAELLADLPSPDSDLDRALTTLGRTFHGAALPGSVPGWRYAVRHPA